MAKEPSVATLAEGLTCNVTARRTLSSRKEKEKDTDVLSRQAEKVARTKEKAKAVESHNHQPSKNASIGM